MNTDRKIGFAMGILLIGLVAALFFRNEPLLDPDQISVNRERELNQRLRDRDVAVYLTDSPASIKATAASADSDEPQWTLRDVLKDMNQRNRKAPAPVSSARTQPADIENDDLELDGYRSWRGARNGRSTEDEGLAESEEESASPEPVGPVNPVQPALPAETRPLPPLYPDSEPTPENASEKPAWIRDSTATEFDEYIVKYGDTLSAIAERTLGSRGKYLLIYEANRDRMSSPDRLSPGKPIRIPRLAATAPGMN